MTTLDKLIKLQAILDECTKITGELYSEYRLLISKYRFNDYLGPIPKMNQRDMEELNRIYKWAREILKNKLEDKERSLIGIKFKTMQNFIIYIIKESNIKGRVIIFNPENGSEREWDESLVRERLGDGTWQVIKEEKYKF